jgi:hypothetical protein
MKIEFSELCCSVTDPSGLLTSCCSCFPHVINLAVQAISSALKDGKGLEDQYICGNISRVSEAVLSGMAFPVGVTRDDYSYALKTDVLGTARKLVATCWVSGKCREECMDTIHDGNLDGTWTDDDGNTISRKPLQLLQDCETRWSSTHLMVDRVLAMLPVCFSTTALACSNFVCPRSSKYLLSVQIYQVPTLQSQTQQRCACLVISKQ